MQRIDNEIRKTNYTRPIYIKKRQIKTKQLKNTRRKDTKIKAIKRERYCQTERDRERAPENKKQRVVVSKVYWQL